MLAKNSPTACDSRALKAKFKNTQALNSAFAFQPQTLEFQTANLARRFGISPELAATLAQHVFSNGRAA